MPADPDEDLVPMSAPPPRPAGPPPPSPVGSLAWGVVGFLHEAGDLMTQPGLRGVARHVNSDIGFAPPPLPNGWKQTPGTPNRYEMPWPGDPAQARTLLALRRDLDAAVRAGALKDGSDPLLAELDAAVGGLLAVAQKLHAAGWTLGIILPENVLLTPGTHEPRPVDLGFTWVGAYGPPPWDASPGRPDWLATPRGEWLSPVPPVRRQFAAPDAPHFPPVEQVEDVRTLSRLVAWLLTGQPRGEVSAPSGGPADALWRALADGAAGRVATVRELRERVAADPPRDHFTDPPRAVEVLSDLPAATGRSRTPLLAGLLAVGLLAVGGGLFYALRPAAPPPVAAADPPSAEVPQPKPPEPKPPVPAVTPAEFAKNLAALEAALKAQNLPAAGAALPGVFGPGPVAAPDEKARRAARGKYVDLWVAEFQKAVALAAQPARRLDALARMGELRAELKSVAERYPLPADAADLTEKEKQCLDFAGQLASQLGS